MSGRLEWMDSALCAQTDPELFFPNRGGHARIAKDLCTRCPVGAECRIWSLALPATMRLGIWSGLAQRAVRQLREPDEHVPRIDSRVRHLRHKEWSAPEIARELNMLLGTVEKMFTRIAHEERVA